MTGSRVTALRDARGLTKEMASKLATELDPRHPPISRNLIRRVEKDGSLSRGLFLVSRLDAVGRQYGHLVHTQPTVGTVDRVEDRLRYTVRFPVWWIGPVWLRVEGAEGEAHAQVRLTWDHWGVREDVASGETFTGRRTSEGQGPLVVEVPWTWTITAGTGYVHGGFDINRRWRPVDRKAGLEIIRAALARDRSSRH